MRRRRRSRRRIRIKTGLTRLTRKLVPSRHGFTA